MNLSVVLIDALAIIPYLASLICFTIFRKKLKFHTFYLIVTVILALHILYILLLILEWSGINHSLESIENIAGVMIPVLWLFVFFNIIDIQANESIEKSEKRYRQLVDTMNEGMIVLNKGLSVVFCNNRLVSMLDLSIDQIVSHSVLEFLDEENKDTLSKVIENSKNQENLSFELTWQNSAGEKIPSLVSVGILRDMQGVFSHVLAVVTDISAIKRNEEERIKLEQQLVQAQKMEAIGTLAGGIVHDFNNFLGASIGSAQLIRTKFLKKNVSLQDVEKNLVIIEKALIQATEISSQLLTISRNDDLKTVDYDLKFIVEETLNIFRHTMDKSISIEMSLPVAPVVVQIDSGQMKQVLLNIFINSMHAMTTMRPENESWGGTLTVSLQKVDNAGFLSHNRDIDLDDFWQLSIQDSGVGIEEVDRSKIFEPFFTKKQKGTGLGLSMVYNIIKQFNGNLTVYSETGVGTVFNIYLPKSQENIREPREISYKKDNQIIHGEGLVLIIDDEETILDIISSFLQEIGYKTITADNGTQGISLFRENFNEVKAVLLDFVMPKMPGIEVAKELRAIDKDVKVILMSGMKLQEEMYLTHSDAFLKKPFSDYELSQLLHRLLHDK